MEKKLFRNEHDKMIAGVASGLADYLQVEVTILRLLFALSVFFLFGTGILAYIIFWIVVPVNNDPTLRFTKFNDYLNKNTNPFSAQDQGSAGNANWSQPITDQQKRPFETQPDFNKFSKPNDTGRTVAGLMMLVMGCFFLMHQLDFIPNWFTFRNFFKFMWPMVFIALWISIIAKSKRKNDWVNFQHQQAQEQEKKTASFNDAIVADENKPDETNSTSNNPQP